MKNAIPILLALVLFILPADCTVIFLTSGTTWNVPAHWNSLNNTIEVIGGGAGAQGSPSSQAGGGGGGGAYSKAVNVSLTPSSTVGISVGVGGTTDGQSGTDTYLCNATTNCASISGTAVQVGAKGGTGSAHDSLG